VFWPRFRQGDTEKGVKAATKREEGLQICARVQRRSSFEPLLARQGGLLHVAPLRLLSTEMRPNKGNASLSLSSLFPLAGDALPRPTFRRRRRRRRRPPPPLPGERGRPLKAVLLILCALAGDRYPENFDEKLSSNASERLLFEVNFIAFGSLSKEDRGWKAAPKKTFSPLLLLVASV